MRRSNTTTAELNPLDIYTATRAEVAKATRIRYPTCLSQRDCRRPCPVSIARVTFKLGTTGSLHMDAHRLADILDEAVRLKIQAGPYCAETVSDLVVSTHGGKERGKFDVNLVFALHAGYHYHSPVETPYHETVDVADLVRRWLSGIDYLEGLTRRLFAHRASRPGSELRTVERAAKIKDSCCYLEDLGLLDPPVEPGLRCTTWSKDTSREEVEARMVRWQAEAKRRDAGSFDTGWPALDAHIGPIKPGMVVFVESNQIDTRLALTEILTMRAGESSKQVRYYHTQGARHDGWVRRIANRMGMLYTDVLALPDDKLETLALQVARDVQNRTKGTYILDLAAGDPVEFSRLNPLLFSDFEDSIIQGQHHVVVLDTLRHLRFSDREEESAGVGNGVHSAHWLWRVVRRLRHIAREKGCVIIVASEPLGAYDVNPDDVRIHVGLSINLIGDRCSETVTAEIQGSDILYLKAKFDTSEIKKCRMHYIASSDQTKIAASILETRTDLSGYGMM